MLSVVKLMRWLDSCQRPGACNLGRDAKDQTAHPTGGDMWLNDMEQRMADGDAAGNGLAACPGVGCLFFS